MSGRAPFALYSRRMRSLAAALSLLALVTACKDKGKGGSEIGCKNFKDTK